VLYITNTNSQPTSLASPTHLTSEAELRAAPLRAAPLEVERLVASKLLEGRVVEGRVRGVARRRVASGGASGEAWGEARGGVVVRRLVGLLDSPLEPSDHLLELALLERVILARLVRGLGKLHEHLTQLARTVWYGVVWYGVRSPLRRDAWRSPPSWWPSWRPSTPSSSPPARPRAPRAPCRRPCRRPRQVARALSKTQRGVVRCGAAWCADLLDGALGPRGLRHNGSLLLLLDLGVLDRSLGLRCATSNGKTVAVAMARATAKAPTRR
jgi:hypothetical protein